MLSTVKQPQLLASQSPKTEVPLWYEEVLSGREAPVSQRSWDNKNNLFEIRHQDPFEEHSLN